MKVLLMHRDKDFELYRPALENRYARRQDVDRDTLLRTVLWNAPALTQDLEVNTLLHAMADEDEFVFEVAQQSLFSGLRNDLDTILYRQAILRDCLKNPVVVRELYDLMTAVAEETKKQWWSLSGSYPGSMLYGSVDLMETFLGVLRKLRSVAEESESNFGSEGFRSLFAMLRKELSEEYLTIIKGHLKDLKFRKGTLMNAELGSRNEGTNYTLCKAHGKEQNWFERLFGKGPVSCSFRLDPRDEAGARILSDMRNRGISRVALALTQSSDQVLSFFKALRTELAFYVGCINLQRHLQSSGMPITFPTPLPSGVHRHEFSGLYDVSLCLTLNRAVAGNDLQAENKNSVIITGANQGGKTTFLRSIGLAQLMMQGGMFVGADHFKAEICSALFTHYKREEDTTMRSGKFDEELARMSEIAERIVPNSMLLFNESFAATNEREGSEIAAQIVRGLMEKRMRVFYVTHLYEFARGLFDEKNKGAIFLRAEREADGTRTFKLAEGEPLQTSYGQDLYKKVFAVEDQTVAGGPTMSS